MKSFLAVSIILINVSFLDHLFAQERLSTALTIGNHVPDVRFKEVMNLKSKKVSFYDFKQDLIILDFWSTSCTSCVSLFPRLQLLEDKFKGKLQIILVNGKTKIWNDNEPKTQNLLNRLKLKTGVVITLPIVFNSKELDIYFPWQTIPHEVWIKNGVVIAITGASEVNESNIDAILRGKNVKLRTKEDLLYDFSKTTLAEIIYGGKPKDVRTISSSTLVKGYIDGIKGHNGRVRSDEQSGKYIRWYSANESLVELYKNVYYSKIKFPTDNRVVIDVADTSVIWKVSPENDPNYFDNVYSYDVLSSGTSIEGLLSYGRQDLERVFHAHAFETKRNFSCHVITANESSFLNFTKSTETEWQLEGNRKFIKNASAKEIISYLNQYSPVPLIDETNLNRNIDMDLPENLRDEKALIEAFKRAGFVIKEDERELDVVVITDK